MLLAQAHQLQEFEGIDPSIHIRCRYPIDLAQPTQAGTGACLVQAAAERPDARGIDERHRAVHLEIDRITQAIAEHAVEHATGRGRPIAQRVVRHLLEEARR
ncbi:MAG: hypothetical protein MUC86_14215, partial [Burkholderiaceae bacterium]|nr:hypothetical protein [Burkholderiaceae bacterium]